MRNNQPFFYNLPKKWATDMEVALQLQLPKIVSHYNDCIVEANLLDTPIYISVQFGHDFSMVNIYSEALFELDELTFEQLEDIDFEKTLFKEAFYPIKILSTINCINEMPLAIRWSHTDQVDYIRLPI